MEKPSVFRHSSGPTGFVHPAGGLILAMNASHDFVTGAAFPGSNRLHIGNRTFGANSNSVWKGAAALTLRITERGKPGHIACLCLHNMDISHRKLSLLGFCLCLFCAREINSNLSCNNSFTRFTQKCAYPESCRSREKTQTKKK